MYVARANRRWLNEGGRRLSREHRSKKNARNRTQRNDSQSRRSERNSCCRGKYSGSIVGELPCMEEGRGKGSEVGEREASRRRVDDGVIGR